MSVQTSISRVQYVGNNSTVTPYPVTFRFLLNSDLIVVVTDPNGADTTLALTTDYTVTGANDPNGGEIVTVAAIPNTSLVTIYRQVPLTQLTVYVENAQFPAESHERALDKLTMGEQQLARSVTRGFRVRESDGDMSELSAAANTIIGLGPSSQPRTYTAAELAVWLNLTQQFFGEGTKTWLTDSERALAVPDFLGQVGVQLDDSSIWTSDGIAAGDWISPIPGIDDGAITTAKLANGVLSADSTGRAKMADGFLTLAKIADSIFTADATGRGKFVAGFVDSSLLATGVVPANMPAGSVLQTVVAEKNTLQTITTVIPQDNTIPQNTEGDEVLTISITPSSASNKVLVRASVCAENVSATFWAAALFRDSGATAIVARPGYTQGIQDINLEILDSPAATSAVTYKLRVGPATGTLYVNGDAFGVRRFGGATKVIITAQEIKG